MGLFRFLFPTKNERALKRMGGLCAKVGSFEESLQALDDAALKDFSGELRRRCQEGADLDALLPEAFAAVREASRRAMKQRHFDVQILGGIALHEGSIAEMRTGEGKTLVATLAAYLNALLGEGVHVVTVNDYLAMRDSQWMAPIYQALGMTVAAITSETPHVEKQAAYAADITYGTNNEFGFDYLRDNMALRPQERVQRGRNFAIVDEVDSILIDEARTPLIISGPVDDNPELYKIIDPLVRGLKRHHPPEKELAIEKRALTDAEIEQQGHYVLDEKNRQVELTEKGHRIIEQRLIKSGLLAKDSNLYAAANLPLLHHVQAALRANIIYKRDTDYIVADGEVVIVDEHTGRKMPGRRWSEGIHQAVEAKEGVPVHRETQTLASTTFQNYFRTYAKLSGMTGTADTEAFEFRHIYGLDVIVIPTNKPMTRDDMNDLVYMTEEEKYEAIIQDIHHCVEAKRPVLVGTTSVESSERLSGALKKGSLKHNVLNARYHEHEAEIIAQAGRPGAVTIATNMAGRGTDIVLGGNLEAELAALEDPAEESAVRAAWQERQDAVKVAGGLHIIGTERHESRRIDNQLRGRAGRQGDAGSSRFYLSMEDQLMRLFVTDRMRPVLQSMGLEQGEAIEHKLLSRAIERAQRKVEGRNFEIRKNLLEYDNVADEQRRIIYGQRDQLIEAEDVSEIVEGMREDVVTRLISAYIPPNSLYEQWDIGGLESALFTEFNSRQPLASWLEEDDEISEEQLRERIYQRIASEYQQKEEAYGAERVRQMEKIVMLLRLDMLWKEHLAAMDHLRQGIHLRAYAQRQPKQEYKRESFELFQALLENLSWQTISALCWAELREEPVLPPPSPSGAAENAKLPGQASDTGGTKAAALPDAGPRRTPKIGRNDPCICGSGRKYKKCCYPSLSGARRQ